MADVAGTGGRDTLNGTASADVVSGGDGSDRLVGGAGDDVLWGHSSADAAAGASAIAATRVASGLSAPVFAASPPGDPGRLFIVEQHTGRIRILDLNTGTLAADHFLDLADNSLATGGEQGLLGLAFHPNYASNGLFYLNLTNAAGDTEIREYRRSDADHADANSGRLILGFDQPFANHNGGWMAFGADGLLYIASGDGGSGNDPQNNAQNTSSLLGKILRIDVNADAFPTDASRNYAIPAGNPFAGAVPGADEVFHYGLRNPWRASFDPLTGDLWIGDVGQGAREEVDVALAGQAGLNFGWKFKEGFNTVFGSPPAGLTDPILHYDRTTPLYSGVAVTGGYVYRGGGGMDGLYIFGDFASANLWSVRLEGGVAQDFLNRNGQLSVSGGDFDQIASFAVDGTGRLYVVGLDGDIHRLTPGATAGDAGDVLEGGAGNDTLNGGAGADSAAYAGVARDYAWFSGADGRWTVQDLRAGLPEGTDTLSSVEALQFSDRSIKIAGATTAEALGYAFENILRSAPPAGSDAAFVNGLSAQVGSSQLTYAQAVGQIVQRADSTTAVAALAYQFFTGALPSKGGFDFLVAAAGPNPNNLNAAYYQSFNIENRYINFAVNLGKLGEGRAAFEAEYGPLTLAQATKRAYGTIFGAEPTDAKVAELLAGGRDGYFALYGGDGLNGVGTKAAMVGWLLAEAAKADLGTYARSGAAFLTDLADGAAFATNLIAAYGQPGFVYTGQQNPSEPASGNLIQGTAGNDTLAGTAGDDNFQAGAGADLMTGGGGNDVFAAPVGSSSAMGEVADRITDWSAGDRIDIPGGQPPRYYEMSPASTIADADYYGPFGPPTPFDFRTARDEVVRLMRDNPTVDVIAVEAEADVLVFVDADGENAPDLAIWLIGAKLTQVDLTNFI